MKTKSHTLQSVAVLTALFSTVCLASAQTIWNGTNNVSANTNWSTAANWLPSAVPGATTSVRFIDNGAEVVAGTINNVLDATLTVGSLQYGNTNGFHTTLIAPGVTLTNSGNLGAGTETDNGGVVLIGTATITGAGGKLVMTNTASSIIVRQGANGVTGAGYTLDMSGLDTFFATLSRIQVGDAGVNRATGILLLARTNQITATGASPSISVGLSGSNNGAGRATTLSLGQTNAIFADSISVGRQKQTAVTMNFNSIFTGPVAFFRGANGVNRVATWMIGDGEANSGTTSCNGTCDFTGGTVDALVTTMTVGRASSNTSGTGNSRGALTFNGGTIDVSTLQIGLQTANTGKNGVGTVNVNGGKLVVNTAIEMARVTGGAGAATTTGTLNINGGTVVANIITNGGSTATITITSGTLVSTNPASFIGTVSLPINNFTITDSTLTLAANLTAVAYAGTLTAGGTANTINVASVPLFFSYPAQFPLISYQAAAGDNNTFVAGTIPGTFQGYISNNVATSTVDLVITNGPALITLKPINWNGLVGSTPNGNWDISTKNWITNGVQTNYFQGDFVAFDDTLAGTTNVVLTTAMTPSSLTINNSSSNYLFTGTGRISGATGLLKQGSGALILDNAGNNDFVGAVTISGGTLQIGNSDTNGNLPSGAIQDDGTLAFNRTNNISFANVINGSGSLSQIGSGRLTLTGANTYSGNTIVRNGTLTLTGAGAISSGGLTSVRNGTLDVSAMTAPSLALNSLSLTNGTWVLSGKTATLTAFSLTNSTISVAPDASAGAAITTSALVTDGTTNYVNIQSVQNIPDSSTLPIVIPLIGYSSATFDTGFNFGVANLVNAYITNNVANNTVDLVLTAVPFLVSWNGGSATDSLWSDAANWNGIPIAPAYSLIFDGTTRLNNTNDTAPLTAYTNVTFNAGAGAFTLNGNPINGVNITNNSSNPQTIDLGLSFARNIALNGGTGGGLIVGGGLTNTLGAPGSVTVTLAGNGILTNILASTTSPGGTNLLSVNDPVANWTLMNNASSATVTVPWALNVNNGTFNFGAASSAPVLVSTTVNGAPQDNQIGIGASASGTLNISNGTFTTSARVNTGAGANATGNVNVYAGTFNIGNQFQGANGAATAFSTFNMNGGTVNVGTAAAPNSQFYVASRGTGTLNMNAGVLNCGTMDVSRNAAGTTGPSIGVVNLNGGLLAVNLVTTVSANVQNGSTPTATFNFNGGTLKARAASTTFFKGGTTAPATPINAYVQAGGAIIDTTNFNITVAEPMQHDPALGATLDGGLKKFGPATLTLSGGNSYTGPTQIGEGTLFVSGSLDVTAVTVSNSATLAGNGSLGGSVLVKSGGTISPAGTGVIGTLTVAGAVTLQGTTYMEVNRDIASSDLLAGGSISYGGTLSIANLGSPLQVGDQFTLFSSASLSGSFIVSGPAGVQWDTSTLATDGIIKVSSLVNATPTNIVTSVSGNQLTLSWPADHTGWRLQVQTNSVTTGLNSNWVDVPGSTGVNSMNFTISPANGAVFFRMVYP
jgi:autotransporter-associated beta strand protein